MYMEPKQIAERLAAGECSVINGVPTIFQGLISNRV